MDKRNIDELFRDKFKAFREIPDDKVWAGIENSLDKKRKRRVIALWWPLGGVAALLAIGFFVFNTSNDPNTDTPILSDTENTNVNDNSNGVGGDTIWDDKKDDRSNGQKGAFPITEESDAVVDGPAKSANDAENRHPQRTQVATSAHDGHNSGVSRTERGVLKKIYNAGFDKKEVQFRISKNSETPADRDGLTNREKNDGMATNRMTTTKAEMPRDARTPSNILGESVDAIAQTDETKKNDPSK